MMWRIVATLFLATWVFAAIQMIGCSDPVSFGGGGHRRVVAWTCGAVADAAVTLPSGPTAGIIVLSVVAGLLAVIYWPFIVAFLPDSVFVQPTSADIAAASPINSTYGASAHSGGQRAEQSVSGSRSASIGAVDDPRGVKRQESVYCLDCKQIVPLQLVPVLHPKHRIVNDHSGGDVTGTADSFRQSVPASRGPAPLIDLPNSYCASCGTKGPDQAAFCHKCGAEMPPS